MRGNRKKNVSYKRDCEKEIGNESKSENGK